MKNKLKQIIKPNFQSNIILINKIGKKKSIKKREKKWVNLINLLNSRLDLSDGDNSIKKQVQCWKTRDLGYETNITS